MNSEQKRWFGIVSLLALLVRLALLTLYQPVSYSDTHSYQRLALAILGGWETYDGTRTPGYPLFLALFNPAADGWQSRVWLVQLAMGMAVTLLLFYIGWQVSGQPWVGGVVGLAHTLNLGQVFFEPNLLTETPATFWIVLTFAGIGFWLYQPGCRSAGLAFGLGITSSLAWLTRPLFIYFPFFVLLFGVVRSIVIYRSRTQSGIRNTQPGLSYFVSRMTAFLIPVALILGGWVGFIHTRFGDWSLTTMTGYNMIQHTGVFFELVPDKYAGLRDTYLKYRDAHIAEYGTQTNTIWEAIPEMQKVSGMTFFDLSRTLARISTQLIRAHPDLFLKNVLEGWWMFWRSPVYWQPQALHWQGLAAVVRVLVVAERVVLVLGNLLFVILSTIGALLALPIKLPGFFQKFGRPRRSKPGQAASQRVQSLFVSLRGAARALPQFAWLLAGMIWSASILQTLLDHGDNPRFLVPLQSLVVVWLVLFGVAWFSPNRRQPAGSGWEMGEGVNG